MKKILLMFIMVFVALNFVGCGGSSEAPVDDPVEVVDPVEDGKGKKEVKNPKDVKDPKGKKDKEDDGK